MSNVTVPRAPDLDLAVQAADAAALTAGVSVRDVVDLAELGEVVGLFATIWGRDANPPVTLELLRAFTKAGNYVGGAFEDGRLVGACVGFFHAPAEDALHSHIAGVSSAATGRSVGFALKLHQRSWALLRGVSEIAWTFDPLVSRNAHFNLVKLGALPVEYLPNFYGAMPDRLNGADDSDRLLVRWPLRATVVQAAATGDGPRAAVGPDAVVALGVGPDGLPVRGRLDAATSLVAVPADVEALRRTDPRAAQEWRRAVRDVLTELAADGARITGFDRTGGYVVRRTSEGVSS
ncbi:GNAT family N-acetyltransferase [Nocardioides sp. cx-173]|uniref:GNAT family N-acetyltransferase n=1 Tax=Nocardioides sp. cx-173 TaxID=2898796 RepID=UPI001E5AF575|nr:GNAT family N-acetyltransferase [Nocardioides sp. cx-173]MCD4523961.1 GNAT family N-acetyltransferase [Nocardioides sp. cx-173]UGB41364.1 GNAT family N-acetyltransferase [Nocardioides sp. cx-173]